MDAAVISSDQQGRGAGPPPVLLWAFVLLLAVAPLPFALVTPLSQAAFFAAASLLALLTALWCSRRGSVPLPLHRLGFEVLLFLGLLAWVLVQLLPIGALGVIVCAALFNFQLGVWFSGAMVILAAGYILYDTSNVLHRYHTEQYVAASLALFASVALLFWYVLRIVMAFSGRD